jgi:glyoxylase-like metal-dependent hydrolase (beta-lactamase superfamily II)
MKVHHLNCGTMKAPGAPLVCHVLCVETNDGLVLVDSGYGLRVISEPRKYLGTGYSALGAALDPDQSAVRQVERLGFAREDVHHIIATHFDSDHIGGIPDFPAAKIHTTAAERLGAIVAPSWKEKIRYRSELWAHGPKFVEHTPDGEAWRGFAAARPLDEVDPGIVLVSLPGHSRGHLCVAVDAGDRWILHAGDAFYHPLALEGRAHEQPRVLRMIEGFGAWSTGSRQKVKENHERLGELQRTYSTDLSVVCAHDPTLFVQVRDR